MAGAEPQIGGHGHDVERAEEVPFLEVFRAAERQHHGSAADHTILIGKCVEISRRGCVAGEGAGEQGHVGFRAAGRQARCFEAIIPDEIDSIGVAKRFAAFHHAHLREGKEAQLIRVLVEGLLVHAAHVRFRIKEVTAQHNGSKSLDRGGKLGVGVVLCGELLQFVEKLRIERFASLSAFLEFGPQGVDRRGRLIGLAEGHVKRHCSGAVRAQNVKKLCELRT